MNLGALPYGEPNAVSNAIGCQVSDPLNRSGININLQFQE
jgi:hypothetical protein